MLTDQKGPFLDYWFNSSWEEDVKAQRMQTHFYHQRLEGPKSQLILDYQYSETNQTIH